MARHGCICIDLLSVLLLPASANLADDPRDLTACRYAVERAVEYALGGSAKLSIEVHGYAPDAPSEDESNRLSVLRALAVAEVLSGASFPEIAITVIGHGVKLRLADGDPANVQNYVVEVIPR